jgi:hypothetical protein
MRDDIPLAFFIEMGLEFLDFEAAIFCQEFGQFGRTGVAVHLTGHVKLDPIAGGKQHGFALIELVAQGEEGRVALIGRKGEALAQGERRGLVIQTHDKQSQHFRSPPRGHT